MSPERIMMPVHDAAIAARVATNLINTKTPFFYDPNEGDHSFCVAWEHVSFLTTFVKEAQDARRNQG